MPAPGAQHQAWSNPYEATKARVSEWTARDIATIASKLDKQLGPEYISARAGPGGQKVHYLSAEKCITLANEVFGFNGWSSSIQNIQIDFADENPQTQRVSIGLSVIVRITLKDGTYHEDIGYGSIDNARGKAMAFEKAKKEGTTDGMKRALRSFGNVLGNCVYDKDYVKEVVKIKANPVTKFDANNLHRHTDFIKKEEAPTTMAAIPPTIQQSAAPSAPQAPVPSFLNKEPSDLEDFLGELDEADFCVPEDGHPDEIMLPPPNKPSESGSRPNSNPGQQNRQSSVGPSAASRAPQTPGTAQPPRPPNNQFAHNSNPAQASQIPETVGFFSAKAVTGLSEASLQNPNAIPSNVAQFNPKAESPSIRRTPGIDHTSSRPLARNGQHVAPSASQVETAAAPAVGGNKGSFTPVRPGQPRTGGPANAVNPSLDHARRVGAPGGGGSPLANRGSYKPPTMKRPPLADLPNNGVGGGTGGNNGDPLDAKRQRVG